MTVDTSYATFARSDTYRVLIDTLLDIAGVLDGESVVDVGSGSGAVSIALLERCTPSTLVLADPDEAALLTASATLGDRARYVVTPAEQLGEHVAAGSADQVVIGNAVHLFDDVERALHEVGGVLRPGGHVCLNTAFHRGAMDDIGRDLLRSALLRAARQLRAEVGAARESRTNQGRAHLSKEELHAQLARAGFASVEVSQVPMACTLEFLAAFIQTETFVRVVLPAYDPSRSGALLSQALIDVAASAGHDTFTWEVLFAQATKAMSVDVRDLG